MAMLTQTTATATTSGTTQRTQVAAGPRPGMARGPHEEQEAEPPAARDREQAGAEAAVPRRDRDRADEE